MEQQQYMTVEQAAAALGVGLVRVYQLVKSKRIAKKPFNRKSYYIVAESLEHYRRARRKYAKGDK